jgi:hypothetical protein
MEVQIWLNWFVTEVLPARLPPSLRPRVSLIIPLRAWKNLWHPGYLRWEVSSMHRDMCFCTKQRQSLITDNLPEKNITNSFRSKRQSFCSSQFLATCTSGESLGTRLLAPNVQNLIAENHPFKRKVCVKICAQLEINLAAIRLQNILIF